MPAVRMDAINATLPSLLIPWAFTPDHSASAVPAATPPGTTTARMSPGDCSIHKPELPEMLRTRHKSCAETDLSGIIERVARRSVHGIIIGDRVHIARRATWRGTAAARDDKSQLIVRSHLIERHAATRIVDRRAEDDVAALIYQRRLTDHNVPAVVERAKFALSLPPGAHEAVVESPNFQPAAPKRDHAVVVADGDAVLDRCREGRAVAIEIVESETGDIGYGSASSSQESQARASRLRPEALIRLSVSVIDQPSRERCFAALLMEGDPRKPKTTPGNPAFAGSPANTTVRISVALDTLKHAQRWLTGRR